MGLPERSVPEVPRDTEPGRAVVPDYATRYPTDYFVESGSADGRGIEMMQEFPFRQLISIELLDDPWQYCHNRFLADTRVRVIRGDTREVLPRLLPGLHGTCLFWLDGHLSDVTTWRPGLRVCPVREELDAIAEHVANGYRDIILIDDARLFQDGYYDYPSLLELSVIFKTKFDNYRISNELDIIRAVPGELE